MMDKIFDGILSYEGGRGEPRYLMAPKTVSDFFSGNHFLRIPDYQRPYSWTKKNIEDLLHDVHKLSLRESSWFLGPIFTVRKSDESRYCDLLDGQQRTTTIQIILREASLFDIQIEGFDFKKFPELHNQLKMVKETCKRCLIRYEGLKRLPVFVTEPAMSEVFTSYIVTFDDIETLDELIEKRKRFEHDTKKIKSEGSITAGTILDSIQTVQSFLNRTFKDQKKTVSENLSNFIQFINALISKCWVIEIPLQSHDDSIQIFESLNNRGKSLTLVDKLRFKSILKVKDALDATRSKWKEIYAGLDFMITGGYVKNEDDFYKVFFNSLKGDNCTREDEFMNLFETHFLIDDQSINRFLEETTTIIEFYKIISSALNDKNSFVENFDKKDQSKVKGILQLLKQALAISDNSRFLLFYLIRTNQNFTEHRYTIVAGLWNIIRYVLHEEIYANKKSNVIRTEYLERVKNYCNGKYHIVNSLEINDFGFKKSVSSLMRMRSSSEAKFLLYFYTYLTDHEILSCYSPSQYAYSELDHMCPQKWVKHWSSFLYTKEYILNYLDSLERDASETYPTINWTLLKADIDLSDIVLTPERSSQYEESLIEFIGNKWVLHAGTNIKASNNDFPRKKLEYQDSKWVKIPKNDDSIGIDAYETFTYKEVIDRTLKILNTIISGFQNKWDNV